jgi:transposase
MTMPGIGPITAVAYVAALEKPDIFKRSRAVGAWLGLTPAAADPDRAQNLGRPDPRTPIMRRLHADRGDNPGIEKIVDE